MVAAAARRNNGAGTWSPPRRRPAGRRRRVPGVWSSPICGSGESWWLRRGRRGEGEDLPLAFLYPGSVFAAGRPAPSSPWSSGGSGGAVDAGVRLWLPWPAVVARGGAAVVACLLMAVLVLWFSVSSPAGRGGEGRRFWEAKLWFGEVWCLARAQGWRARRWWWHGLAAPAAGGAGAGRADGLAVLFQSQDLVACVAWLLRSSSMLKVFPLPVGSRFALCSSGDRRRGGGLVVQQGLAAVVLVAELLLYEFASVVLFVVWL